jgi:hypothetical protein
MKPNYMWIDNQGNDSKKVCLSGQDINPSLMLTKPFSHE